MIMKVKKISISNAGRLESAILKYREHPSVIRVTLESGVTKEYSGSDVYECLGKIIKNFPEIKFFCKGAKLNVRPSSMLSQMTAGTMAYEHKLGVQASRNDIVNIFDYEDKDIINDPTQQKDFFFLWLESLKEDK